MRVVVFGPRGMLGEAVCRELDRMHHTVIDAHSIRIDDFNSVRVLYESNGKEAHAVINCAGSIPSKRPTYRDMVASNSLGPHNIAKLFTKAHLVHVSTDCVYSGRLFIPYTTSHLPDPVDAYGRSKLAGELVDYDNATTVRTSFVGVKHGLLRWFLDSERAVQGWTNVWWSGSTVLEVARGLVRIATEKPRKLVHLAGPELTKHDALVVIKRAYGVTTNIARQDKPYMSRSLAASAGCLMKPFGDAIKELAAL